ncbi:MAG: formimidoylglutamate deiminase [Pseudomonadota bacterium]
MLLHASEVLTPEGWAQDREVRISADGRILAVGPQGTRCDHVADLLLPAPTNLHSHTFQRAMAGLTEARGPDPDDSFWTWRRLMYRFLDRLRPEDVEAIAALAFVEMLETGYGAVAEFHYLHHCPDGRPYDDRAELSRRIARAAEAAGIGLTLLPVLYQVGGCDGRALDGGQRRFGNDPDRYAALLDGARAGIGGRPDARLGVAPHSLRAVTRDGLASISDLAGDGPIHMHLAEQQAEVAEVQAHRGARPVDWALDHLPLGPGWCLIHCTQMTAAETQRLAATGAVAGLCPLTEASLGDGIFPARGFVGAGGRFGIGTDSNIDIALFGELSMLEYGQRLRDRARAVLATPERSTGRVLFEAACSGGAQAAGRNSGAIAPGAWADLIALETTSEILCGRRGDAALDTIVFGGRGGRAVTDVWSAGRHVVREGRHIARDALVPPAIAAMRRLGEAL